MAGDSEEPTYPKRWETDVALSDGGTMSVRPIRPDDAELIVAFHERQSPESIYFRFFSPRPRLSERDLDRFTHVDYVDRMAFVGIIGDELVGVARYDRHRARSDAEVAFFIDDAHHGRGMATVLLEYLAVAAREAGISGFTASVLPQNRKMLGVFTQAGFTAHSHYEEGVVEVELGIEPTPEALAAIEARASKSEARSVKRILAPTSIAVVGASRAPGTIGHQVFEQLVHRGFEGPVYPVNQEATYVASVRAWQSVLDVPGELDLAVICVPADQVLRVVEECAIKRVQGLIVLSSGFADQDDAGEQAEVALVSYARRHGMRLIGPNALGVINTDPTVRMHATFVPVDPLPGRIGLMAQSGVIGAAIVDGARQVGLGISTFVAVGNKADVSGNDMLRYWTDDPNTDVAMMYLESFGNPSKFSQIARDLSRRKPVVAVKVDGSEADQLDDPDALRPQATSIALLEQAGVIRVDNLTQMFHTAGVLANQALPRGSRVVVVTNSWGPAWLAVDALRLQGLDPVTPVDLHNDAEPERFLEALQELYSSDVADAVLVIYAPGLRTRYRKVAAAIREAAASPDAITTVGCLLGNRNLGVLADDQVTVPEFPFPEEAALALGRVARYAEWRAQPVGSPPELTDEQIDAARTFVDGRMNDCPADGTVVLGPDDATALLGAVGVTTVRQVMVDDVDATVAAANAIGYPVAIKAAGLERLTKTEAGGVSLDVHGDAEVRDAYGRMVGQLGEAMRPALVQAMVPEGVECRIGVHRHPMLGDVLTLGAGGSLAERLGDEAMRIFPITDVDIERLLSSTAVSPLLDEQGAAAWAALAELIGRLAALAEAVPEIVLVRINPVIVHGEQASITDVRITLAPQVLDARPLVRRL